MPRNNRVPLTYVFEHVKLGKGSSVARAVKVGGSRNRECGHNIGKTSSLSLFSFILIALDKVMVTINYMKMFGDIFLRHFLLWQIHCLATGHIAVINPISQNFTMIKLVGRFRSACITTVPLLILTSCLQ